MLDSNFTMSRLCTKNWNSLPLHIRQSQPLNLFRRSWSKLRNYFYTLILSLHLAPLRPDFLIYISWCYINHLLIFVIYFRYKLIARNSKELKCGLSNNPVEKEEQNKINSLA